MTDLILKEKSNYNFTDAFINAISKSDICQYLYDKKACINFEIVSSSVSQNGSIDIKIFLLLIENVSRSTKYKLMKCINQAIQNRNKKLIEFLLKETQLPENALFDAVSTHDIEIVNLILNYNSKPSFINLKKPEGTALFIAIMNKDLDIVKRLLSLKGIDPNLTNVKNENILTFAVKNGDFDVVECLLKLDRIDVNTYEFESYNTPLMISIEKKYTKIAELLIQNPKTDLNLRNIYDESALIIAVKNEQKYIVDLLINNERFDPIQSKFGFAFFNANPEISIQLSTSSFLDVNYTFEIFEIFDEYSNLLEERTAFVHSVLINDIEKFNFIISHPSFDVFKSDIDQALFIAAENNNIEIFEQLFDFIDDIINHSSFDVNQFDISQALFIAAENNNIEVFRHLLKYIDDINIFNQNSESLLFHSVENLSGNIIDEILNNPKFDPIKSQILDSFIHLIINRKEFDELVMGRSNQIYGWNQQPNHKQIKRRYRQHARRAISFSKNFPQWQNKNDWKQLWQGQTDTLNEDMFPEKSSIIEIVTKLYNFDKEHSHLIDFQKLLPDGHSFFTVLLDYDEVGFVSDFLLDHGVDPNMPDSNGLFPLMNAIKMKSFKFISSLINSNKINYSQIGDNTTYLHIAALFVDKTAFNLILEKSKIDINSEDKRGCTPLMIACKAKNVEVIDLLFEKDGLDYLHSDSSNKNALDLVKNCSQKEFEESIKSKDAFYQKLIFFVNEANSKFEFDFGLKNEYLDFALGHKKEDSSF